MRRLLRAVRRRLSWSLVGFAAASVAGFAVAGLLIARVDVRSAPVLTAFEIGIGLIYLGMTVAGVRERLRDYTISTDDQFDIKFMRPLSRRLRTLVFAASVAGVITAYSGMAVLAAAQDRAGPVLTTLSAGLVAATASYGFGRRLAERALLREKADKWRGQRRMAELAEARAAQAAKRPPPDPDAATRRRIAERSGTSGSV